MIKPSSLRAHLTQAIPELRRDPDKLQLVIDRGSLNATAAPGLSFEYAYTATIILLDFTGHPDSVMVPLLIWITQHQSELLANPARRGEIGFEAEILSNEACDLSIKLPLTERVGVHPRPEGGCLVEHYPEPTPDPYLSAPSWQVIAAGEVLSEWDAAPAPSEVAPPPAGDFVTILANVQQPSGRTAQFARDADNVLWRYTDESEWRVLYPLSEVDGVPGEDGAPVEMQVGATHLQWRYIGEAAWRDLIALDDIAAGGVSIEEW